MSPDAKSRALLFAAAFILSLFARGAAAEELTLADGGASEYTIVLPENPTPVQTTAARELAATLKEISGAELPVVSETAVTVAPEEKILVIGPSAASRALLAGSVDEDALGYDAIVIRRVGRSIVFSGHPVRGTLYAVDTFLEDELGCRWWTSDESFIPKCGRVAADDFDTVYTPKLINRESFYNGVIGPGNYKLAVHLKCNGNSDAIPEEYGGHQAYLYFVHSFYQLIPPTEFEAHPDWFPEIDGIRKVWYPIWAGGGSPEYKEMLKRIKPEQTHPYGTQLCLTNEELFQEMLRRVLAQIEAHPEVTIVSISQNDWQGYCECEKCRAIAEEEESQMGPYIRFVNRMAEEIEKVYPNLYVDTLAYQFTRKPPKLTRARKNVIVRLCSIECSFIQPLGEGEQNASFRDDLEGWSRMADHLFVWDYMTNFSLYMSPFPNYRVWDDNIKFFIDNHTIGLFEQGDYQCPTGDYVQMRAWVVAKLLWNPELNQRELMKEFIAGYYAPELVPIYMDYFDLLSDRCEASGIYLGIFRPTACDWIDLATLLKATELQNRAREAAASLEAKDPQKYKGLSEKVRRERMPLDLVWLMGYPEYRQEARLARVAGFPTVAEMKDLAADFNARLDAYKIAKYAEVTTPPQFAEFKENFVKRYSDSLKEADPPEINGTIRPDRSLDLQTLDFRLTKPDELTFREEDPKASDGATVRIPSTHHERSINCDLKIPETVPRGQIGPLRLYAAVRAESADGPQLPEGALLRAGFCSQREKEDRGEVKSVAAAELNGADYTWVDLGECPYEPGLSFWIAPVENAEHPFNVYVDRVVVAF